MPTPSYSANTSASRFSLPRTLAFGIGLIFLTLLPLSVVLDIHHLFAAWDHDGHHHADFDLCQWVQQHTGGSLCVALPVLFGSQAFSNLHVIPHARLRVYHVVSLSGARAPPCTV